MGWRKTRRGRHEMNRTATLAPALEANRALFKRIAYRTVIPTFTFDDVIDWLFPPDVLETLKAAYPYAGSTYNTTYNVQTGPIALALDLENTGILKPTKVVPLNVDAPSADEIMDYAQNLEALWQKHSNVERVIRWFTENATLAATRYYFPSVGSLLVKDHDFHKSESNRFKETKEPITQIAECAREATVTIASGLLCPDLSEVTGKGRVTFHVGGNAIIAV